VLTNHTAFLDKDVWHIRFTPLDQNGNALFHLPFYPFYFDGPSMEEYHGNIGSTTPEGHYVFNVDFKYDTAFFNDISTITSESQC